MALTEPTDPAIRKRVISRLVSEAALPSLEILAACRPLFGEGLAGGIGILLAPGLRAMTEASLRAAAIVASEDPRVFDVVQGFNGESLAVRIRGAGRCGTLTFFKDRVDFDRAAHGPASTILSIDPSEIIKLISGKESNPLDALLQGAINYGGESVLLVATGYLLLRCLDYLGIKIG